MKQSPISMPMNQMNTVVLSFRYTRIMLLLCAAKHSSVERKLLVKLCLSIDAQQISITHINEQCRHLSTFSKYKFGKSRQAV